ncbi:bifunctional phosphoribosyl-AMP cyclohydrolase/phosphoribosyl-ATP diphosphatase HisIE [Gammaproteobacteria bacterium]|nr:bifunctional phosphoribosyl-AMP cyclohydrolase/phosphoribosyl-ATP diphosphatase HisIE [Gammaproteobacteria bacterium]MDA8798992.1 bifunctional phosphoribosyl-AMP cyclohydrolase/phosphoribosyl-ATP diphosphatase HisIE [Gammaproteobacteria bacterium]MDC0513228.1 bifunctional phosphoribosyl-AMP cyclohydrolase/phosphoribosyl-ATP diphosphatase HisIE [Gammaproteobacteria bacterium]MDC0919058.1 bifunctional phosphoribosyl-AMP cyclohydrolase/phosphoribosyl-ATP diphosphatase HisIE [Gammaproteobacteria 
MKMITLDWKKVDGLIPAIIQDSETLEILMLGYMNKEALKITQSSGFATFYSRSQKKLWTKGETSGNKLAIKNILHDCDKDTLLVLAKNSGPTCHLNNNSCFLDAPSSSNITNELERTIDARFKEGNVSSYTYQLYKEGIKEIAKKVTEEAGEASISAVTNDGRVIDEAADLIYHLLVMLRKLNLSYDDVLQELKNRSK